MKQLPAHTLTCNKRWYFKILCTGFSRYASRGREWQRVACLSWKKRTKLSFFMHSLRTATELGFRKKAVRQSWSGWSTGKRKISSTAWQAFLVTVLMDSADGSVKLPHDKPKPFTKKHPASQNAAAKVSANCIRKKYCWS